jgi:hypothetical protein
LRVLYSAVKLRDCWTLLEADERFQLDAQDYGQGSWPINVGSREVFLCLLSFVSKIYYGVGACFVALDLFAFGIYPHSSSRSIG